LQKLPGLLFLADPVYRKLMTKPEAHTIVGMCVIISYKELSDL